MPINILSVVDFTSKKMCEEMDAAASRLGISRDELVKRAVLSYARDILEEKVTTKASI